jgi:hypothetical protein
MKLLKQKSKFTQVPNELIEHKDISLKAKGLYAYMYSKPENWNFTIKSMVKLLKDGEKSITSALNELKDNDWIYYQKFKNGKGIYFIATEPNAKNLFLNEILPKLQNVDLACKDSEKPFVEPNLQNGIKAFSSRISNIVTNNNITTTTKEDFIIEINDEIINIAQKANIEDIDFEFKKFENKDFNKNIKNKEELIVRWEQWVKKYIEYASKKETNRLSRIKKQKSNTNGSQEQKDYRWEFRKAKNISDKLKDWLLFDLKLDWKEKYYWKNIKVFEIKTNQGILKLGWEEKMHPDFNKEEILLYRIEDKNKIVEDDIIDI